MKNKKSGINFSNSYLTLNKKLFTQLNLTNTYKANIKVLNEKLAKDLEFNIEYLKSVDGKKLLTGSKNEDFNDVFSQAYAGHQFGHLSILGDGRALMLGEQVTSSGERYDIQLKGSGRTPYSRGGDGKATLYSMLREYLISESMHSLHIPTARTLAVLETNELVQRNEMLPGAILTRVAKSHIRFGTFTYASIYGGQDLVQELTDYTINRHYKHLNNEPNKYVLFLREVIENQAYLIAKWQSVGFIHGVMNTDNVLVSGETIDYGPCAFMNIYDQDTVYSSIDTNNRYSYGNQPSIMSWNLARFTETIMNLLDKDDDIALRIANKELEAYENTFNKQWLKRMALKIGINRTVEGDKDMIDKLLALMESNKEDFTNTFRLLSLGEFSSIKMYKTLEFREWLHKWKKRLNDNSISILDALSIMKSNNPQIIPRNNLVEEAINNASKENDYSLFETLLEILNDPYNYKKRYAEKYYGTEEDSNYVTFCGT